MTTDDQRRGALDAIERIVNRGDGDVVSEALAVLERLYPSVSLGDDGTIRAEGADDGDEALLTRAALLISAHVTSANSAQRPAV